MQTSPLEVKGAQISAVQPDPLQECLILASRGDDLGALIKSRSLEKVDERDVLAFCEASAQEQARVLESALTFPVKRQIRNVKRRLLRAMLHKQGVTAHKESKGMRYSVLKKLATNLTQT